MKIVITIFWPYLRVKNNILNIMVDSKIDGIPDSIPCKGSGQASIEATGTKAISSDYVFHS